MEIMGATQTLTARFDEGECLYTIISVKKDASTAEIKKAYHKLALLFHPDRVQGDEKERAKEEFQTLGRIYEILSDDKKRKIYDETGSIDDDDFVSTDRDWEEYWRLLFKKITAEEIDNYAKSFKGSELEVEDVKKAYLEHQGDMESIIEGVVLSSWDDEERFRSIIDAAIKAGEVPVFDSYRKRNKKRVRAAKRREKKEAQELERESQTENGNGSLEQLIVGNRKDRFSSLISNLESKYGGDAKAERTAKRKHEAVGDEATEEEFLAARKRLETKKVKGKQPDGEQEKRKAPPAKGRGKRKGK